MLCKSPYMIGPLPCPCQRCMPCRVSKKRLWTFRMELEAQKHINNCVATLTYNNYHLPKDGNLEPPKVQKFIRSIRKILAPQKIRYFLAGEYGENTLRPHYHIVLFGLARSIAGGLDGRSGLVKKCWKYGHTLVDDCKPEAMAYIAGYVTKKLTKDEREQKNITTPEFVRMSLRPGIGAGAIEDISRVLSTDAGLGSITLTGDVPYSLRFNSKNVPIGRYLRGLLREKLWGSRETPIKQKVKYWQEMWKLRKEAENDTSRTSKSFAEYLVKQNAQKVINLEARNKIYAGKQTF